MSSGIDISLYTYPRKERKMHVLLYSVDALRFRCIGASSSHEGSMLHGLANKYL